MIDPDRLPRIESHRVALADATPRQRVAVLDIREPHRAALAHEGVGPGSELEVESVVPLGGPLIVRVGNARLAIARTIARAILVEAVA